MAAPRLLLQPDAQSLWVSPDGRWVAAFGQRPRATWHAQMPTTIFLFDAESGQVRVRIPIPDVPAGSIPPGGPAPPLAFDAESRLLAVATTKSLSLFSVPEGTPLISEALPESGNTPPGQPLRWEATRSSRCPPASSSPGEQTGCSRPPIRRTWRFPVPIGGSSAAAKLVEQVVLSWDVALPKTRIEDHPHDGPVRAVKLEPRDRFVVAAGDDRMIRVWDRGGGLRWSVGYPGVESLFSHVVSMPDEHTPWRSGSFDPTGAVFFTRLLDRIDVWDATNGERRGSFTSVLATSPDTGIWSFPGGKGRPRARELRILDVSRNTSVLSIPMEQNSPIDCTAVRFRAWQNFPEQFSPDSRFLVVGGEGNPGPGRKNSTLLIADVAEARVVARVQSGYQWAIGPAGKVLVVSDHGGRQARAPRLCTRHRPANR